MTINKKTPFDMSQVRLYEWGNLYWYEDEIFIGLNAISKLITNQEKTLNESLQSLQKLKEKKLPEIPDEYRASYEQQFFEDSDKTNYQLRIMQRYSSCLMIMTFFENTLKFLAKEIGNEINNPFSAPKHNAIPETIKFLIQAFKINESVKSKEYNVIIQQRVVRDSIAHNNGFILKNRINQFKPMEGINLNGEEIIIRPEYLNTLIKISQKFYKDLILLIDDRFIELAKK
ncbi:MAG: hypothetical protein MK211_01035 [Flavobacteriales bacterium]|uniref:hypothetical protein n=1 Tax=Candidatus Ulvibacter alkanivorans TaxID=2267620 RepID=UPI000DF399B6|nr:hypothetical protein [Candidatus Ulvibacter alkanivorans]MCH2488706.1 hypothetical protein [Flavobacteriales bacterium]